MMILEIWEWRRRKRLLGDGDGFAEGSSYLLALDNTDTDTIANTNIYIRVLL